MNVKLHALGRNSFLSIAGGMLAAFSFPNPIWKDFSWQGGFLAFFCIVPLLAIRVGEQMKQAWLWGMLYGFTYFGIAIVWMAGMESMHPLGPLAWFLLTLYLAVYPAVFLRVYHTFLQRGWPAIATVIPLWVLLEFIRNYFISGFPWVALGYAHYHNPWLMALAPVGGVWGISFVTLCVNAGLYLLISRKISWFRGEEVMPKAATPKACVLSVVCWSLVIAILICGAVYEHYQARRQPVGEPVKVAVLQGAVNQDQIWNQAYVDHTLEVYRALIAKSVHQGARLVLWPETAFPGIFNLDYPIANHVRDWSRQWDLAQMVGADEVKTSEKEGYEYYNTVFFLNQQGRVTGRTSKRHLVPFGEYVPYKHSLLYFINKVVKRYGGAGFTPGEKRRILNWDNYGKNIGVGALVCFESLFPDYARELCNKGAEVLAVVTNDTWFGNSAAPAQHAIFSALRAAETHRYVLRAATSGVSMIFDPQGRIAHIIPLYATDQYTQEVRPRNDRTLFVRMGNWICWICAIVVFLFLLPVLKDGLGPFWTELRSKLKK